MSEDLDQASYVPSDSGQHGEFLTLHLIFSCLVTADSWKCISSSCMPLRSINVENLTQTSFPQDAIDDQEQVIYDLANSILSNSKDSGPISALETAIYFLRESLQLRPRLHSCRSESLHHLATALITRFDRTGQVADLEEAIRLRGELLAAWKSSLKSETDVLYGCVFRYVYMFHGSHNSQMFILEAESFQRDHNRSVKTIFYHRR